MCALNATTLKERKIVLCYFAYAFLLDVALLQISVVKTQSTVHAYLLA
jgi:hypothetical protein